MADKNRPAPKAQAQVKPGNKAKPAKPEKKSGLLKPLLFLVVLMALLGAGFAAGVFLNLIDLNKLNQTYKLYDYPVIGRYFPKPIANFELTPLDDQPSPSTDPAASAVNPAPLPAPAEKKEPVKVDLEKEIKAKQAEEQKRISRMARLYGAMKPDEAVSIMTQLDDDTVIAILGRMEEEQVSKILALMDAKKAARLTQEMLKVKPSPPAKL